MQPPPSSSSCPSSAAIPPPATNYNLRCGEKWNLAASSSAVTSGAEAASRRWVPGTVPAARSRSRQQLPIDGQPLHRAHRQARQQGWAFRFP